MIDLIHTIEKYTKGGVFVRYAAGDCDVFTYCEFAHQLKAEGVTLEQTQLWLECETAQDAAEITRKLQEVLSRL